MQIQNKNKYSQEKTPPLGNIAYSSMDSNAIQYIWLFATWTKKLRISFSRKRSKISQTMGKLGFHCNEEHAILWMNWMYVGEGNLSAICCFYNGCLTNKWPCHVLDIIRNRTAIRLPKFLPNTHQTFLYCVWYIKIIFCEYW